MALRLIRPTETITVDRLVCTIFGDPGTGKTTLANTAENCVTIDFDRGSHRARNRKDVLAVDSWHDVLEIMAGTHLAGYRTVHVDAAGTPLMHIEGFEPLAENPVFTIDIPATRAASGYRVNGRDNNGNAFTARIAP